MTDMRCSNPDCENDIPSSRLKHNSTQKYCSRECAVLVIAQERKQSGFFTRFSRAGNKTQQAFKEMHGHWPISDQSRQSRSEKITQSNRENPRRKQK